MGVTIALDLPTPWRDRAGRLSPLRIAALALLVAPALWIGWLAWSDGLGPEPLNAAMHATGRWALRFLLLTLAVTPFGRILAWPRLFQLRRMIGLGALAWVALHLVLYAADQNWVLWRVVAEIAQRFYLTIGFAALAGLAVLGWTSTDGWMKRLGRRWKRLHRLVFPIAVLALLHAFIQAKSDTSSAVFLLGLALWLLGWRLMPARRQQGIVPLAALSAASVAAAIALEYAWYALATKLPAERVLAANFDALQFDPDFFAPRPAILAGMVMLGVLAAVALRRLAPGGRAA
ncbi:MAG: ferric reductase-like transmembrane domain-containing protein [Acetobacteraceae bacterium]|nr:ferric reductase-like transmembrane domain-containing protein [Acetobacteraceae bacterium]